MRDRPPPPPGYGGPIARPPFALERLHELGPERLSYDPPKSSRNIAGTLIVTPLELLDRLAALVPPPRVHRHRYYGVLSPNAPLRHAVTAMATAPGPPAPVPNPPPLEQHRGVPPATPGRGCSRASMKCFRCCVRSAAPRCASSPSSPTARPCATSSSISVSRPHHPGSHPPAPRHCGRRPRLSTIRHPIRRSSPPRPTSSISASLGSRIVDRHPRATPGGLAPAPTVREPRARRRTWVTRAIGEQRLHGNAQPPVSPPARSRQPTDNAIHGRLVWLEFLFVIRLGVVEIPIRNGHHMINKSGMMAVYLEVGSRAPADLTPHAPTSI